MHKLAICIDIKEFSFTEYTASFWFYNEKKKIENIDISCQFEEEIGMG